MLRQRAAWLAVILFAVAAAFAPCLGNGFTNWDDDVYVTGNPLVKRVSWDTTREIFSSYVSGNYHPLVFLTYALEYRLFGEDPRPYHATSLALHLLVTALVFSLLLRLSGTLPAAAAGAFLWALHPFRVETVGWVAARKDLLAATFFLGALLVYLRAPPHPGRGGLWRVAGLYVLALLSKGTTVMLPPTLLLCDYLRGGLDWRAVREKLPLFALAAFFGAVAVAARASYAGVLQEEQYTLPATVFLGGYRLLANYLGRSLAPFEGLFPLYPRLDAGMGFADARLLGVAALLALMGAGVAASARRTKKVVFGSLFFSLNILPSLGVEVVGVSADRFTYLPSVGIAYLCGELFSRLWGTGGRQRKVSRLLLALGLVAAGGALGALSRRQCGVWRDSVTLWTHAVGIYPASPGYARNRAYALHYRALAHRKKGEAVRALADMDQAIALSPQGEFLSARGAVRAALGDAAGARRDYSDALQAYGRLLAAGAGGGRLLHERGMVSLALGDTARAASDFTAALAADPRSVEAYNSRGIVYTEAGDAARAAADFTLALQIQPLNPVVLFNYGVLHLNRGEYQQALPLFERALRSDPAHAGAHMGRARALFAVGDYRGSLESLERAEALGYPPDPALRDELRRRVAG